MLYILGLIFIVIFAVGWPLFLKVSPYLTTGCSFLSLTGLYCPACGGTRALSALLSGHLITSLRFNPAVAYGAAVFTVFMVTQTVERLSRGHLKIGLKYRNIYVYLWLGLLMGWWLIRNVNLMMHM